MEETSATMGSRSLEEIILEIHKGPRSGTSTSTIFRVPPSLREVDAAAFTPKLVALGPYHRGNPSLQEMQHQKPHHLYSFLESITIPQQSDHQDPKKKLEHCMNLMLEFESAARSCYYGKIDMDNKAFAEMMLLDGCFILELLRGRRGATDTPSSYLLVALDMLMLENQIPFFVLEALYELVPDHGAHPLQTHVLNFARSFFPDDYNPNSDQLGSPPSHLLHQIHSWMVPIPNRAARDREEQFGYPEEGGGRNRKDIMPEVVPSAVELKEAGVKLRRKRGDGAAPLEVSFEKGVLRMSQLKVYDHFRFVLRNLVALEHCWLPCGRYVTDYVFFVDRLVNTARDVAVLHAEGLLVNGLGSEEEAAHLINGLAKNMIWDSSKNQLKGVFGGIGAHCGFRWRRWRARLMRDYFGSPWSIVALVAASTVLLLALTQTVYTVLSYYKN